MFEERLFEMIRDPDGHILVRCGDHTHRIAYRHHDSPFDGEFEMEDHDEVQVRAFVAFDAKPPACFEALTLLRKAVAELKSQRGKWTGLNWTEYFGATGVELEAGMTHLQAVPIARDWEDVPEYLKEVEAQAAQAESDAQDAVGSMFTGNFEEARAYADEAWGIEQDQSNNETDVWRRLYHLVDQLLPYEAPEEDDDA
jgi:hypothetical protein